MESVRKGLRSTTLTKDTYERLQCVACGENLATENPPDEPYTVRTCPSCGEMWKEVG
jgi:predicted RNA-binding Zn-ribbon protein involved in translation (DUF1610 family)